MKIILSIVLLGAFGGLAAHANHADSDAFRVETEKWRADRVARLSAPDGWLSLVGLHWLESGWQTLGHAEDNDLVLAVGPAHLGRIGLIEGRVLFEPSAKSGAEVLIEESDTAADSNAKSTLRVLKPDSTGKPTVVRLGEAQFTVIERSGRFGLRVKDPRAATRTEFSEIEQFPIDSEWRLNARFEPHEAGRTIDIASVINTLEPMPNPGAVVFEKDGRTWRLEAVDEGDGELFLIFADRTNGKLTYGPGRFLYAPLPKDGKTVVDFNRAYNPPCAFNAYSTCPLPPPENRLDMAVTAGEKKYAHGPASH